MEISEMRQVGKMELFDVTLDSGTLVRDCKVMDSAKGKFISGPARSFTAKDGTTKWFNMVQFSSSDRDAIFAILLGAPKMPEIDVNADLADDIPF